MMRRALPAAVLGVVGLAAVHDARAEEATAEEQAACQAIDCFRLDLSVPDSPAFVALGVSPTEVTRPRTTSELTVALSSILDGDGSLNAGIAIDVGLEAFLPAITVASFRESYVERLLRRIQFGVATSQGEADATSGLAPTSIAASVRVVWWEKDDPRDDKDLHEGLATALAYASDPAGVPTSGGNVVTAPADVAAKVKAVLEKAEAARWNRSFFETAMVATATSADSTLTGLDDAASLHAWLTFGKRLGAKGQALGHARYAYQDATSTSTATVAGRLFYGGARAAGSLEGAVHLDRADGADDTWGSFSLGIEFGVGEGQWLNVAFGSEVGKDGQEEPILILSNLKWHFGEDRVVHK